jgi:iron complex transport system ATP-binding protein
MSELIACEKVGYRQQGVDILSEVDWRIDGGQHWAVLGPNGSGKTTLLRIVCGYLWPTSGRVLRLGRELIDLGELRKSIGWISSNMIAEIPPQDTGLETVVTGRFAQIGLKHLPFFGPSGSDYADAVAELSRLDCESLAAKPFGILSQGERQQVLIARARMARPLLLVLDEPCAGMDPGVRERFLAWLNRRLCESDGPTTILVTHHIEEVVPALSNALVLSGGRIHSLGRTDDIVTRDTIERVYRTRVGRIEKSGGRLWPIWGDS